MQKMFRTKYLDPDFRKNPKTDSYCIICQRDLKDGQSARLICYELDVYDAIHVDDWEEAADEIKARRAPHLESVVYGFIGGNCAKKLGLDFSKEISK